MRYTAARLNRGWLFVLGLLLLLAGTAGTLVSTGALTRLGAMAGLDLSRPAPDDTVTGTAATSTMEMPVAAVAVAVGSLLLVLAGLAWLIRQVPRRRLAKPFRLHDDGRDGFTRVDPDVLTDAVERDAKTLAGVSDATAQLRGSAREPQLTLRIVADEQADVQRVLGDVQSQTVAHLQTALDTTLARLAVRVDIDRARHSTSAVTL